MTVDSLQNEPPKALKRGRSIECTGESTTSTHKEPSRKKSTPSLSPPVSTPSTSTCNKKKSSECDLNAASPVISCERDNFFANLATEMKVCQSYQELQALCVVAYNEAKDYPFEGNKNQTLYEVVPFEDDIDHYATKTLPFDIPGQPILIAKKIYGDGNCLARCGSILAFNHEQAYTEVRCRIVIGMCLNQQNYLDPEYLALGHESRKDYHEKYAMMTEQFMGEQVKGNLEVVRQLYQKSVFAFRKNGAYAGMWELHAMSDALCINIFSVYPMFGFNVRNECHRLIMPHQPSTGMSYIMWSDLTEEQNPLKWHPNHFVVLLDMNERRDR